MVELLERGFAFEDDDNYLKINCSKEADKLIDVAQFPGIDIFFDHTNLTDVLPTIPSKFKYLQLHCESVHYPQIYFPDTLEYIQLDLDLSIPKHPLEGLEIAQYIKWPIGLKALSIVFRKNKVYNEIENDEITRLCSSIPIPLDIEYLRVNYHVANMNDFTKLKTYIIDSFDNYLEESADFPLDNLPQSLEWLDIMPYGFNQPLNNLPADLKVLKFGQNRIWNWVNGYSQPLDNLPVGLEVLYLPESVGLNGESLGVRIDNLPRGLKILFIPRYIDIEMDLNELPDTIEIINWCTFKDHYERMIKFPANLKKINVMKADAAELQAKFADTSIEIVGVFDNYVDYLSY